jgi:hypothetical protein
LLPAFLFTSQGLRSIEKFFVADKKAIHKSKQKISNSAQMKRAISVIKSLNRWFVKRRKKEDWIINK